MEIYQILDGIWQLDAASFLQKLADMKVFFVAGGGEGGHGQHHSPANWSVAPFILLLTLIATGPVLFERFWHHNYPKIAVSLSAIVVLYYLIFLRNFHGPVHAFFEFFQFISLVGSLYVASGGIYISIEKEGKALGNSILLLFGAVIANFIGTTGASMLLIKPYLRLNRKRVKPYHVIFFILIVSNIGGALTPIGDPPLFLGFLKGVPFFWTVEYNLLPWVVGLVITTLIFFVYDKRNKSDYFPDERVPDSGKVEVKGKLNFLWLALIIVAVFVDPNIQGFEWVPAVHYDGAKFSFVREIAMLTFATLAYLTTNKKILKDNDFNMEPIREVAFIFIGIFGTMMPALEMVGEFAKSPAGAKLISVNTLYWGTGFLSGFLDNAPTYLNFLAAALSSQGGSIQNIEDVQKFAAGGFEQSDIYLMAISVAAVFFGALTYIGNGPNFMVKSIAEQVGVRMPSFFGYIIRYSLPILLPMLIIVWLIFFF